MNNRHLFSILSSPKVIPAIIVASLIGSGSLIARLANAEIKTNTQKRAVVKANKLDINNDGLINLYELTRHQNQRFQKLDRNDDGQIDKIEFNARLVAMFNRIDGNNDGVLDDDEISNLKNRHHSKDLQGKGL